MTERTYTPDEWAYISEQGLMPGDDIEELLFQWRERGGMNESEPVKYYLVTEETIRYLVALGADIERGHPYYSEPYSIPGFTDTMDQLDALTIRQKDGAG